MRLGRGGGPDGHHKTIVEYLEGQLLLLYEQAEKADMVALVVDNDCHIENTENSEFVRAKADKIGIMYNGKLFGIIKMNKDVNTHVMVNHHDDGRLSKIMDDNFAAHLLRNGDAVPFFETYHAQKGDRGNPGDYDGR